MAEPTRKKSIISRIGNTYRHVTQQNLPTRIIQKVSNAANTAAVNSGSEVVRNITSGVTGVLNLPSALNNRLNAVITRAVPEWTEEKADDPRNTWTIDKRNHLARYYDSNGKQVIVSPVGTGLVSGDKVKEGDNKSPNGTYRLSGPENGVNKKGGRASFGTYFYRTNHANHNGGVSGVGIHGTGTPLFNGMNISHGCFRVDNSAIEKFHEIAPNNGRGAQIVIYEQHGGTLVLRDPVKRFKQKYRSKK